MPLSAPDLDINLLLHQGRSALLRALPRGAQVFLSAGCAGRWFFEWVEACYGPVPRHVGVEFYAEKPADLPANVEWISNTCSDMSLVPSSSCDLLFSGQNLEHLWPDEVIGFLLEAARTTRPGGLLVMDSPNRTITEMLRTWSHPEHTIEFTAAEAAELVEAAGFTVAAVKGILLTREPLSGALLPAVRTDSPTWSVAERMMLGIENPEDALLWWVEARRTAAEPNAEGIRRRVEEVFARAWPERVRRSSVGVGQVEWRDGEEWVRHPASTAGPIIYGPYMPLPRGRYQCVFRLHNPGDQPVAVNCDVVVRDSPEPLGQLAITVHPGEDELAVVDFTLHELRFGVEFRCFSQGQGAVLCRRVAEFKQLSSGPLQLDRPAARP